MHDKKEKIYISVSDPEVQYLKQADPVLSRVIALVGDITCNIHDNPEQFLIETIVGQMLSNKAARKINDRMCDLCHGIPTASVIETLSREQLRSVGISYQKVDYIKTFAAYIADHPYFLDSLTEMDNDDVIRTLVSMKGIGTWTAKMYLLFVLRRDDVIPFEDGAFMQAFRWCYGKSSKAEVLAIAQKWLPYASTAARFLYRALDYGYTKYDSIESAEQQNKGNT